MKGKLIFVLVVLLFSGMMFGQVKLGLRGGGSLAGFYMSDVPQLYEGEPALNFVVGLDLSIHSFKKVTFKSKRTLFRTGLQYLHLGSRYQINVSDDQTIKYSLSLSYLRIPLILEYKLLKGNKFKQNLYVCNIYFGGYSAYNLFVINHSPNLSEKLFSEGEVSSQRFEIGFSFGLRTGVNLKKGVLILDFEYSESLKGINNKNLFYVNQKNRYGLFTIGYQFGN